MIYINKKFKYDFDFKKCENLKLIITNQDDIAKEKIKDGYLPYIDPSRDSFEKCFMDLNEHYYILVKVMY